MRCSLLVLAGGWGWLPMVAGFSRVVLHTGWMGTNTGRGGFNRVKERYNGMWVSFRTVEEVVSSMNERMEGLEGEKKGYTSSLLDFDSGPGVTERPDTPLSRNADLTLTRKEAKTQEAEGERMSYAIADNGVGAAASAEREVEGGEVLSEQWIGGGEIGEKDSAADDNNINLLTLLTDGAAGVVNMVGSNRTTIPITSPLPKRPVQLNNVKIDDVIEGKVHHLVPYGAFVDVGADFNGLIHISQMSDKYVQNCSDVAGIGETVMARVIEIDPANKRLSLTLRAKDHGLPAELPDRVKLDDDALEKYRGILRDTPDLMMKGKVSQVKSYGAFIILEDGVSGFVHFSHILEGTPTVKPSDVLKSGQNILVRLREVDLVRKRINLSMLPLGCQPLSPRPTFHRYRNPCPMNIEDFTLLSNANASEWHSGVVTSVADFGAFVHAENFVGLIHLSRMPRHMKNTTSSTMKHKYKVGDDVNVRVVGVNEERRRADLSATSPEMCKDVFLLELKNRPHDVRFDAIINTIMPYCVFVTLGSNIDGMLHLNEISGNRERGTLNEVFNIGDSVNVRLLDVDVSQQRVKLTMMEPGSENQHSIAPRNFIKEQLNISYYEGLKPDEWVEGKVVSTQDYGAFISLDETTDGMVHISEIAEEHIEKVQDVLSVGQAVKARVISVDRARKRISLSMIPPNSRDATTSIHKRKKSNPWSEEELKRCANMDENQYMHGKVVNVVHFGAFVQLENGCDALLHVQDMKEYSGLSLDPHDILEIGQQVTVSVKEVDFDKMMVSLRLGAATFGGDQEMLEDLKKQDGNFQRKNEETGKRDTSMYVISSTHRKPRKKSKMKEEVKNHGYKEDKINWAEALRNFYM
eukprot:246809_1